MTGIHYTCHHQIVANKIITKMSIVFFRYLGSKHKFFDLIDKCADNRPEESVINLITYRANDIYTTKPGWINAMSDLLEKYFSKDTRPTVRIKAMQALLQIYKSNRQIHEEEILKKLVLPFLGNIDSEPQLSVRIECIRMITAICIECSSKKCIELLDVLEKVVMQPIDLKKDGGAANIKWSENRFDDITQVVVGLIQIFCAKICQQPVAIVIRAYHILVRHLEVTYDNLDVFGHTGHIRKSIFQLFMQLRANEKFHLGVECERGAQVHFSPFLLCRSHQQKESANNGHHIGKHVFYISLTKACVMVIRSLSLERDYTVLKLVLDEVPSVLQNKAIFSLYGSDIKAFIVPLIELTNPTSVYPDILFNLPPPDPNTGRRFSKGDFQNRVFPVLAAIAPYSEYLEGTMASFSQSQVTRNIVQALQNGLLSKECSRTCIVALTACSLEMKKTMYNMIEKVLLSFSKISATKHVATPMLEFLSTLIRLPDIFSSFRERNYLSVFAIALPFTNPFKFDAYTVSLAHHVLIMWFLKCRLSYRQNFVSFIVTGLNSNILKSFEEGGFRRDRSNTNAVAPGGKMRTKSGGSDIAARLRSNSLTENPPPKTRHVPGMASSIVSSNQEQDKLDKMVMFHSELSETCVDMLATYMFANVAVRPKRMPTAEFLLKGGQSASWVIGTKIVTVTTSICDQVSNRGPLCDRCYLICLGTKDGSNSADGGGRHKSSEARSSTNSLASGNPAAEDDPSRRRHVSDAPLVGSPSKCPLLLNRRGSIEKVAPLNKKPDEDMTNLECLMESQKDEEKRQPELCSCWCTGWAEIHVRRPSGDVSWMSRIQNASLTSESHADFPLTDLTTLFHPDKELLPLNDAAAQISLRNLKDNQEGGPTYSVFNRGRTDSESTVESAPGSPVKTLPGLDFRPTADSGAAAGQQLQKTPTEPPSSPITKSPVSKSLSADSPRSNTDETNNKNKQSCDPIPEVDEEERNELLRRRTSLQPSLSSQGSATNICNDNRLLRATPPAYALTTPPSTPHARESSGTPNLMHSRNRTAALQAGSYGSTGGMRDRAHTFSGPSPRRSLRTDGSNSQPGGTSVSSTGSFSSKSIGGGSVTEHKLERVTGISPQFVFLTLYHSQYFGNIQISEKPMLINPSNKFIESSLKILDRIHP
jgi:tuberous sclerosis protein 2